MTKRNRKYIKAAVLGLAATVILAGCGMFDGDEAQVDFGQFGNTQAEESGGETQQEAGSGSEDDTTGNEDSQTGETQEDGAGESDSAQDKPSESLMEEFYKSEFSEELMAYFEASGRGDEAFSQPIFDSENKVYSQEEISQLSDIMCKIFRNEIYARHGMIFGDEDLNQLYGPFSWYEGTISLRDFEAQEELPFNATEYANIKNVVTVEKARKNR